MKQWFMKRLFGLLIIMIFLIWASWTVSSFVVERQNSIIEPATVVAVVDGDTIDVSLNNGTVERVRLIGIDTPESVSGNTEENCQEGILASEYTHSLLPEGTTIYLQSDKQDRDAYGRLLRYVWLDNTEISGVEMNIETNMLNGVLVRQGYAQSMSIRPDTRYADIFENLEIKAINDGIGVSYLWS